ncbi:hypothetical protein [uncultured Anaerococcus sp.]|uniref:hypothetical protein n=1 Tax=uncultured Anaerococcus sp. TaxID=293428 RepID=UPI00288ADE8C|nr:hypothetical protein [uncultured Anaerococcus sp.]
MGLLKKIIVAKGTKDLASNLARKSVQNKVRRKKMFNNKYKNKPNIISRLAKAAFMIGAGAYLLKKNQKEVEETVKDAKEKANRAKDDFIDAFNGEDLK